MVHVVAQAATTPQAAQATDGVTNFFLVLAVAAFAVALLRMLRVGELLTTVGSVLAAVVVLAAGSLLLFTVLVVFGSLLRF